MIVLGTFLVFGSAGAQDSSYVSPAGPYRPPPQAANAHAGSGDIRDAGPHVRQHGFSLLAFIPWYSGIGIGVMGRYEIPVAPNGFIPAINDQFSLEPSLGLSYTRDYAGYGAYGDFHTNSVNIAPALYAEWSFHISPKFRPYAAIGLGWSIGISTKDYYGYDPSPSYFYIDTAAGLFYKLSEHFALRGELGLLGPKAGMTFFL